MVFFEIMLFIGTEKFFFIPWTGTSESNADEKAYGAPSVIVSF